jgi:hypothetical protein
MSTKLTDAQIRAKKKWAEKNKERTKYMTNKAVTKIFITSQLELKDFEEVKNWFNEREKELNNI